jgi:hypothetical protein
MPIILAIWEAEVRRIVVYGQPWRIVHETLLSKITKAKWSGSLAQTDYQHSKHEALSSNPSIIKTSKYQKKNLKTPKWG